MALLPRGDEVYGASAGADYGELGPSYDSRFRTFGGFQALSAGTCPKCGKGVLPDSSFCWNCGFKLSGANGYDSMLHAGSSLDGHGAMNGFSPAVSLPFTKPLADSRVLPGPPPTRPAVEPEAMPPDVRRGGQSLRPLAVVGGQDGRDGKADVLYTGIDADRNGVPDILEDVRRPAASSPAPGSSMPDPLAPTSHQPPEVPEAFRPAPTRPALRDEAAYPAYPFPASGSEPPALRLYEAPPPQYAFPTAGSFVAEPFQESGQPAYVASGPAAYPSALPERWSEEPMPRDPVLDRYSRPLSRQMPDPFTGDWYRDGLRPYNAGVGAAPPGPSLGAYSNGYAGINGASRCSGANSNGYASSNGYAYPSLNKGDTYSGGTVSYGPPPGRCGTHSPAYGGAAPCNPFSFPSIGSFVAEPFAPGAPSLSSRPPPLLPPPLPCLGGPSLLGNFNVGGFSLPPPTGSFVADAASYAAASQSPSIAPEPHAGGTGLSSSPTPTPSKEKAAIASHPAGKAEGRAETSPAPKAPPRTAAEKSKKRKQPRGACC